MALVLVDILLAFILILFRIVFLLELRLVNGDDGRGKIYAALCSGKRAGQIDLLRYAIVWDQGSTFAFTGFGYSQAISSMEISLGSFQQDHTDSSALPGHSPRCNGIRIFFVCLTILAFSLCRLWWLGFRNLLQEVKIGVLHRVRSHEGSMRMLR